MPASLARIQYKILPPKNMIIHIIHNNSTTLWCPENRVVTFGFLTEHKKMKMLNNNYQFYSRPDSIWTKVLWICRELIRLIERRLHIIRIMFQEADVAHTVGQKPYMRFKLHMYVGRQDDEIQKTSPGEKTQMPRAWWGCDAITQQAANLNVEIRLAPLLQKDIVCPNT